MKILKVKNLNAKIENKVILRNISFEIDKNSISAIIGPNGSGKTTLARCILNDKLIEKSGKIFFEDIDITNLETDKIAKLGIYLSMQQQPEIEYIKTFQFFKYLGFKELEKIKKIGEELSLPKDFLERGINERFSGGEKKKFELLLIKLLNPKLIIFDEIDSGLDIKSIDYLINFIESELKNGKTFLIISHNVNFLENMSIKKFFILVNGEIKREGDEEILEIIKKNGFNI
ncbi:MAG: ATP-binding cassette domain-containing protein [Candidatus Aenigmatarchaeota archaeon]